MKYKIIKKRDEALGYDKYKETAEYKQKFEKKQDMIKGVFRETGRLALSKAVVLRFPKYNSNQQQLLFYLLFFL